MELKDSYFIKRNGNYIWLAQGIEPQQSDEIIETRKILVARDGYTLSKGGQIVDAVVWIKDDDKPENYAEVELPQEPEEEDAQEG